MKQENNVVQGWFARGVSLWKSLASRNVLLLANEMAPARTLANVSVNDLQSKIAAMLAQDDRYKALLVAALKRSPSLPNVPTFADSGLAPFEATAWSALMAPAGTPEAIVNRINAIVNEWIVSPEGVGQLAALEMMAEGGSPKDLDAFIAAEIAKWGPIIEKAGIRAQP